jgi:hypothetical protein
MRRSNMTTLRDRCAVFLSEQQQRAIMRVGDPVRELMGFVLAERGRTADKSLEESLPLVLYFGTTEDREEMVAAIREAKPNLISRPMP